MIPILFDRELSPKTIVNSNNLGLGMLNDCISATVTEELNGKYELTIEYPVDGIHFADIDYCSWIKATPHVRAEDTGEQYQLFRVYKISKPINGVCTISAEHVSYMLSYAIVRPYSWTSHNQLDASDALDAILDSIVVDKFQRNGNLSFNFNCLWYTDEQYFLMEDSKSVREYLLGKDSSIISTYGSGEYRFNNFEVYLYAPGMRGTDRGVTIEYGKNMTNLKMDVSDEEIITGYYPYWLKEYTDAQQQAGYPNFAFIDLASYAETPVIYYAGPEANFPFYPRVISLNLADFEQWKNIPASPSASIPYQDFYRCVAEYARSQGVIDDGPTTHARRSIDVTFIDPSTTEQYHNIEPLQKVWLGDYVTVKYPKYQIQEQMRVVTTQYDVLHDRYNQLTLGQPFDVLY